MLTLSTPAVSGCSRLSEQAGQGSYKICPPPELESEENLCSYLNVHMLTAYFLRYKVCPFSLSTLYSFCVNKNILKTHTESYAYW